MLSLFPVSPKRRQYNLNSFRGTSTSAAQADNSSHGNSHRAGECLGHLTQAFQNLRGFSREFTEPGKHWLMSVHRTLPQHGSDTVNATVTAQQPQYRRLPLSSRHLLCSSPTHLLTFPRGKPGSHSSSGKHTADPPQSEGGIVLPPCPCQSSKRRQDQEKCRVFESHSCVSGSSKTSKYYRHQVCTKELPLISLSFMR